jgi:hypothetical protein
MVFPATGFLFDMNAFEIHAAAMGVAEKLTGACPVFTWAGKNWQIIPTGAMLKKPLGIGGFGLDSDIRLFALVNQFAQSGYATAQAVKDAMLPETPMQYLGDNYKIESVDILPGALIIVIGANSIAQSI